METPIECYKGIPNASIERISEWLKPEGSNALWAGLIMKFCDQQGDKIGVNKARRLWLDSVRRFLEKERAYYDKYHAQPDKFIIVPVYISDAIDMIVISGGEDPSPDVIAMYNDYKSRRDKWAYESAKHSIDKIKEHNYKYVAYALKCREYVSFDHRQELWEELEKALTFKLKIKIVYNQMYGSGPGIITSEGEGKVLPTRIGENMLLSGDVNITTTISGFYKEFEYSPTKYTISTQVRNWDPCETQSCDIWVSTLGLEEEELGYTQDKYILFSEVLIWDYALDFYEVELKEGFHSKLNNLNENAVIQSFTGKDKLFDITVDVFFDLVHTPQ